MLIVKQSRGDDQVRHLNSLKRASAEGFAVYAATIYLVGSLLSCPGVVQQDPPHWTTELWPRTGMEHLPQCSQLPIFFRFADDL